MSKYYLVAKSKTSDKFEIVKIKGNEIYSDESDMLERCFNLELNLIEMEEVKPDGVNS